MKRIAINHGLIPMPSHNRQQLLKAIVGIELTILRVEGKFKLNQNKEHEIDRVIAGLAAISMPTIAQWPTSCEPSTGKGLSFRLTTHNSQTHNYPFHAGSRIGSIFGR